MGRWGMVAPPKFSSLVLLGSFLLQSWDRLEKVCFNEHAMILQGFKKRFLITDACLFQSRFGCQESLLQVQNRVQEESNARHFLDSNVVRPSWRGHRVNPLPPLHSGSFFAAKWQSETCDSIYLFLQKHLVTSCFIVTRDTHTEGKFDLPNGGKARGKA